MGEHSAVFLQAMLFFMSSFAMVAPLIARPFLLPEVGIESGNTTQGWLSNVTTPTYGELSTTMDVEVTTSYDHTFNHTTTEACVCRGCREINIQYAYIIVGVPLVLLGLIRLSIFLSTKEHYLIKRQRTDSDEPMDISSAQKIIFAAIFGGIGFMYSSIEALWGGYSPAYSEDFLSWVTADAAFIPFLFWACMTASRALMCLVARWVHPKKILGCMALGSLISAIVFAIMKEQNKQVLLTIGGLTGFFYAPVVASALSWFSTLVPSTTLAPSTIYSGIGIGGIFTGLSIAVLCHELGQHMFSIFNLVINCCLIALVTVAYMSKWATRIMASSLNYELS